MSEFWNDPDIKRSNLASNEDRYHVYYDNFRQTWNIVDIMQVPEDMYQDPPEDSYIAIPQKIVRALLKKVADTELVDHILADKTYQKNVEERHLDIIEKLIETTQQKAKPPKDDSILRALEDITPDNIDESWLGPKSQDEVT